MKKIIFFVFIIFNISGYLVFMSYGFERWSATNLNGNEDREYYGEVVYTETKRDIKMRQDDLYYYFDIEQNIVAPFSEDNYMTTRYDSGKKSYSTFDNGNKMNIVLAPFSNICHLSHQVIDGDNSWQEMSGFDKGSQIYSVYADKGKVYISGSYRLYYTNINNNIGAYTSDGRNYPMCYYINGAIRGQQNFTGWVERNGIGGPNQRSGYVQYNIPKVKDTDPTVPLTMPEVLSRSCVCVNTKNTVSSGNTYYYVKNVENIFNYTIKIKKDNLDIWDNVGNNISPFRYCNVVSKGNFDGATGTHNYPYCTSINNSIDLSLYLDCEHDWKYKDDQTRDYHVRYCSKCQWDKKEPHDFIYEYDGIANDRCICGTNKNVYITIKDNIGKINERYLTTPSELLRSIEWDDVGCDFLYVEDKELCYKNVYDKEYFVSTLSCIPTTVPNNSHVYDIKYHIHRYYINFHKTNNYNLDIADTMERQMVYYGEKVKLDKSKYNVNGYTFLGWAVEPDLSTMVFDDEEEIYNISTVDEYELNLYPVYNPYSYIIRFTPGRGEGYMEDQVCTYGICENIKGYGYKLDRDAVFVCWRYKGMDISPSITTTIEPYVHHDKDVIVLDTNIYVRERNEKASYENSPTKKPSRGKINTDVGPGIKNEKLKENEKVVFVVDSNTVKNRKEDNKDKDEDKDEDKHIDMYILLATSSIVANGKNGSDIRNDGLYRGVLLAINIFGKMAFCMVFLIILIILVCSIICGRINVEKRIKKLALNT